jgi:hypothetical protein
MFSNTFDVTLLVSWAMGLLPVAVAFFVVMLLDFGTGAMRAWQAGSFSWEEAPLFFRTGLVYLWVWLTCEILAIMPGVLSVEIPGWGDALAQYAPKIILGTIVVGKYVASIGKNIQEILKTRDELAARAEFDAAVLFDRMTGYDEPQG